jgi:putative spermidine/putrescine transport system ATP-binding protein
MAKGDVAFIAVENLTKRYGRQTAVDGISFSVPEGEFLTLLGPSGCGKTTTLRCIAGFSHPDGGELRIGGRNMTGMPTYRRNLGMVFQNYALFPHLSVFENVAFGLRIRSVGRAEAKARVERELDTVRLAGLGERYPKQLSGGQQQRVALARALVYEPRVLLLDEPLSNLDAKLRVEMRAEIRQLQQQLGITALYVTHDQEEALSVSDRIMVMSQGRIEQLSTPWELYNRPQTRFVATFVGTANILPARRSGAAVRIADSFDLPCLAGVGSGDVWVVARPECLSLSTTEVKPFSMTGAIKTVTMLGPSVRIEVATPDGLVLLVDVPHGGTLPKLAPRQTAHVTLDPASISVIPR